MNTTQTTRPAADPLPPPEALPTPLTPLRDRLDDLIEALALDWDDPSLSAGRLCKLYHLKPEQLAAIARLPRFRATIASLETVRAERTATLDARIREDLRAVLLRLIHQDPTNPAIAKEIRLATKQLAALTAPLRLRGAGGILPPDRPQGDPSYGPDSQSAIPVTPPMKSADSSTASLAGGAAGEVPEQSEDGGGNPEPTTQDSPSPPLQTRQEPDPSPLQADAEQDAPRSENQDRPRPNPPNPPHRSKYPRGYKPRPKSKSR